MGANQTAGPAHRRATLNAVGPFFLGNEVWLVAAVGILFGAFPMLEGELLSGFYPAVLLALAGVILVTAAVQLRSRPLGYRTRTRWDRLIVAGSTLAALGAATAVGVLSADVREIVQQPAAAVLLPVFLVTALLVAGSALARLRAGLAFLATALALAVAALLVGASVWPYALVSTVAPSASLTVADAAASAPTLRLLSWLAAPLLPALLGFQLMCWWVFRGRIDGRTPVYW